MQRHYEGRVRILLALVGVLCFSAGRAVGQDRPATLRGFVTDASDGQALQGVNVVLQDEDGALSGIATNNDGFYSLPRIAPGTYALRFSFIGFTTVRDTLVLEAGENRTYSIALAPDEAALDEVLVEGERTGGAVQESVGLQTVRARDLEAVPAPDVSGDLATYLTTMPGVVTTGDRGGQFYIRGGEPSHTLTLLDGMHIYQPFHILGFYSAFPSDILSSADIYAGGFGSQFSGRISSVVDVHTRNGNKQNFDAAGSLSPFVSSGLLEGPLLRRRVSFLASARVSTIDRAARYIDEPLPYQFGDFFGKVHAILHENHQLAISALHTYDRGTLGPDASADNEIRWTNTAYGLRYLILPRSLPILAEVMVSLSRLESELGAREDPARTSGVQQFSANVNITQYVGRSAVAWGFFMREPTLDAQLGGAYQDFEFSYDRFPNPGAYIEPEIYLGGGVSVRPGLVGQLMSDDDFFFEPRLRMQWERGVHRVSSAAGLYRQKIVGLNDRRDATNIFTAWTDAPRTQSSRAIHALLGYSAALPAGLSVSAEGFYKRIYNLHISEWTAYPRFTTRLQAADGEVIGGDLRLEYRRPSLYGFVSYGLSFVEYRTEQERLRYWFGSDGVNFRPPHDRRHQVNALIQTSLYGFEASLRWNFGSGLPYTRVRGFDGFVLMDGAVDVMQAPAQARVIYDRPFGGVLPTYHRLDASLERRFELGHTAVTVQGAVINVYDRTNLFALDVFTLERTDQLPLLPTLGLKVEF